MEAEFHLRREQTNRLEFGRVKNPGRSVHFHSQIEVYLVLSGEIEIWINDRRRVLRAGEISVAFGYDAHGYRSVSESEAAYLVVPTDLLHEFLPLFTERRVGDPFISDPAVFEKVLSAFREIEGGAGGLTTRGYVYVILGTLLEHLTLERRGEVSDPRLSARILVYISENFRGDLTLSSLAAAFGYSPSYLSRSFRETFGVTFLRYLTTVRLREAILLLKDGDRSVTECALESGFGSLRSFYRVFFEEFGCTPREYLARERE